MMKVFSKSHPEAAKSVSLTPGVRQRIWYVVEESDIPSYPDSFNDPGLRWEALPYRLKREHGWQELRSYKSRSEWESVDIRDFILKGIPRFVLDATELFHDLLKEERAQSPNSSLDEEQYQRKLNVVLEDADLPWRMLDGRILQVDSKWLEEEVTSKAAELMEVFGYEGAIAEFRVARSDLSAGDYKSSIHHANLALESAAKSILGVEREKPGALFRRLIESGIVPEYHEGFLEAFEQHILRSVAVIRNEEKGVGHGQGIDINQPPRSLADLAVNLAGVLILYLLKRHMEMHPTSAGGSQAVVPDACI